MHKASIQQTRKFANERAAMNLLLRIRQHYGTKAKCFLRSLGGKSYLKFRIPDDGWKIPDSGVITTQTMFN